MSEKPVPIHSIRVGGVKASIWENQSESGRATHAISLSRSYKDENEQWHETNSYFPEDLPKLELAARKAFEFLHCRERGGDRQPESFTEKVNSGGERKKGNGK